LLLLLLLLVVAAVVNQVSELDAVQQQPPPAAPTPVDSPLFEKLCSTPPLQVCTTVQTGCSLLSRKRQQIGTVWQLLSLCVWADTIQDWQQPGMARLLLGLTENATMFTCRV